MNDDKLLSETISWLRLPMMIGVVFIHLNPPVNIQLVDYSTFQWIDLHTLIGTLCSRTIPHIAVPFFFMISGFFYFYKLKFFNFEIYIEKTKKRLKSLLLPYLIWNIIPLVLMFLLMPFIVDTPRWFYYDFTKGNFFNLFWGFYQSVGDRPTDILGHSLLFTAPYNFPLWFLRDLIVIIILSPLVYSVIKYGKMLSLLVLGAFFYTAIWFNIPGFSITALFFFSLGAYFSILDKNLIAEINKYKTVWYVVMTVTLLLSVYFDRTSYKYLFFPLFRISGVIVTILITSYFINNKKLTVNKSLANASFFLFLSHTVLIQGISKELMKLLIPNKSFYFEIIKYFVTPAITVFICLALYYILNWYIPRFTNFILGSR